MTTPTHRIWLTQDKEDTQLTGTLHLGTERECNSYLRGWECKEDGAAIILPLEEEPASELEGLGQTPGPIDDHNNTFEVWRGGFECYKGSGEQCHAYVRGATEFSTANLVSFQIKESD